jgi:hypothetical protein
MDAIAPLAPGAAIEQEKAANLVDDSSCWDMLRASQIRVAECDQTRTVQRTLGPFATFTFLDAARSIGKPVAGFNEEA